MTKDELKARIDECKAELDSLTSGTGESGEPEVDIETRKEHLGREIASLAAQREESSGVMLALPTLLLAAGLAGPEE